MVGLSVRADGTRIVVPNRYSDWEWFCQRLRQLADTSRDRVRSWLF